MSVSVSRWRLESKRVIERVKEENPDAEPFVLETRIRSAYPFGERRYTPYKIWLEEVNKTLGKQKEARVFRNGSEPRFKIYEPSDADGHWDGARCWIRIECPWCELIKIETVGCIQCGRLHDEIRGLLKLDDFQGFLRTIRSEPKNATPCGVLADWLEERGNESLGMAFRERYESMLIQGEKRSRKKKTD